MTDVNIRRFVAVVGGLLVAVALAACSEEGAGPSELSDEDFLATQIARNPELPPTLEAMSQLRHEVAAAADGFLEAYLNGRVEDLPARLSERCSPDEIQAVADKSLIFHWSLGGEVEMDLNEDFLVLNQHDDDHVTVHVSPESIERVTVDGSPVDKGGAWGAIVVQLAREDGAWRVANCAAFGGLGSP